MLNYQENYKFLDSKSISKICHLIFSDFLEQILKTLYFWHLGPMRFMLNLVDWTEVSSNALNPTFSDMLSIFIGSCPTTLVCSLLVCLTNLVNFTFMANYFLLKMPGGINWESYSWLMKGVATTWPRSSTHHQDRKKANVATAFCNLLPHFGEHQLGHVNSRNSCTPPVDSCQCMAKPTQYCKVKKKTIIK